MNDDTLHHELNAIRAEYAAEEAENAEAEALENEQTTLSVRVPTHLAETLKAHAGAEHIPTSALVRRILTQAVHRGEHSPVITAEEVERIARRVVDERLDR